VSAKVAIPLRITASLLLASQLAMLAYSVGVGRVLRDLAAVQYAPLDCGLVHLGPIAVLFLSGSRSRPGRIGVLGLWLLLLGAADGVQFWIADAFAPIVQYPRFSPWRVGSGIFAWSGGFVTIAGWTAILLSGLRERTRVVSPSRYPT